MAGAIYIKGVAVTKYKREAKPGKAFVDGNKIDFITAGGRTTAYVPELQKLTGKDAEKAIKARPGKKTDGEEEEQESEEEDDSAKPKKKTEDNDDDS